MGFTSEAAREAGRKSKRGKDKFSEEIRAVLQKKAENILSNLVVDDLTVDQQIKLISIIIPYLTSKFNGLSSKNQIDIPLFID